MQTHVIFEGAPGEVVRAADVVIEGAELDDVVELASRVAHAADRIELCGGVPVDVAAAVVRAVGDEAEVRVNRYGFESLEQAAAYKTAFATGNPGDAAFFHPATPSTPLAQHDGVLVAGVASDADLAELVREAQSRGAGLVELYAGLGAEATATAREASGHGLPVGFVD